MLAPPSIAPPEQLGREPAAGDLVELQLDAYPNTEWLLGVDVVRLKPAGLGPAGAWLKTRLRAHEEL